MNPILTSMAEILARPEAWTRFTGARDIHGNPVASVSTEATCWCLIGARKHVRAKFDDESRDARRRMVTVIRAKWPDRPEPSDETPNEIVASFNDHPDTTHQDILELLRLAQQ